MNWKSIETITFTNFRFKLAKHDVRSVKKKWLSKSNVMLLTDVCTFRIKHEKWERRQTLIYVKIYVKIAQNDCNAQN